MESNVPADFDELLHRGYRYAFSLTHDQTRAEDLLQDACVRLVKSNGPWHAGYLFAAIRNRFIDLFRREKLVEIRSLEGMTEQGEEDILGREDIAVEDSGTLERALDRVRPEEREALYLAAVEGYTAKEIGELTGKPRGSVLSLIHRGREKLRRLLARDGFEASS
ncbi:MAG: RNA polymerase sigma factor [Elusimicrobia bacterium]|nr:RNA polymerase sigma factor [Elusimicrobiota bacterium]